MEQHVIILALSTLPAGAKSYSEIGNEGAGTNGNNLGYRYVCPNPNPNEPTHYVYGKQTNEAPVRYLIGRAHGDGNRVTKVVYLCSHECQEASILMEEGGLARCSAEQVFQSSIKRYCSELGVNWATMDGFFVPITYKPKDSAASLGELISQTNGDVVVDVDTTGGLRDAINLMTLAIQTVRMRSRDATDTRGIRLGTLVYGNFLEPKSIEVQDEQYGLIELVNAIDSFTRYGKAEALKGYFASIQTSETLKELCNEMMLFSEDLSLCRTDKIVARGREIHRLLDKLEQSTDEPGKLGTGELLFRSLVPSIREEFVGHRGAGGAKSIVEAIRWCTERQMLQQALSLFSEEVPEYLELKGYVTWGGTKSQLDKSKKMGRLKEACYCYKGRKNKIKKNPNYRTFKDRLIKTKVNTCLHDAWTQAYCCYAAEQLADPAFMTINPEGREAVPAILIWYAHLIPIRNEITHADENASSDDRSTFNEVAKQAFGGDAEKIHCTYVEKGKDSGRHVPSLQHDITKALEALENEVFLRLTPKASYLFGQDEEAVTHENL